MGKAKKTRKFAEVKRMLNPKDLKPCARAFVCCGSRSLLFSNFLKVKLLCVYNKWWGCAEQYRRKERTRRRMCDMCKFPAVAQLAFSAQVLCQSTAGRKGVLGAAREKTSTALFFKYNTQLGPPYQVLVDTNFINFSIKNKVRLCALDLARPPCLNGTEVKGTCCEASSRSVLPEHPPAMPDALVLELINPVVM